MTLIDVDAKADAIIELVMEAIDPSMPRDARKSLKAKLEIATEELIEQCRMYYTRLATQ